MIWYIWISLGLLNFAVEMFWILVMRNVIRHHLAMGD